MDLDIRAWEVKPVRWIPVERPLQTSFPMDPTLIERPELKIRVMYYHWVSLKQPLYHVHTRARSRNSKHLIRSNVFAKISIPMHPPAQRLQIALAAARLVPSLYRLQWKSRPMIFGSFFSRRSSNCQWRQADALSMVHIGRGMRASMH